MLNGDRRWIEDMRENEMGPVKEGVTTEKNEENGRKVRGHMNGETVIYVRM